MNTQHQITSAVREQREQMEPAVRIDAVKVHTKNTLIAFCDFTLLDVGLSIKGASIHERDGARWLTMPSRSYSSAEGTQWIPVVEFASKEARSRISDAVLAAFAEYSAAGAQ